MGSLHPVPAGWMCLRFKNIVLQMITGGFVTKVEDDKSPVLGGNLDAGGFNISDVGNLEITGLIELPNDAFITSDNVMEVILGIDNAGTPDLDQIYLGGIDPDGADKYYNVEYIYLYGKNILLGDSASDDSMIFIRKALDVSEYMIVGGSNPDFDQSAQLRWWNTDVNAFAHAICYSNDANRAGHMFFGRARGIRASKLAVAENDRLGGFVMQGYDGNSWESAAGFVFEVDGPVSNGVLPTRIILETTNTTLPRTGKVVIKGDGKIGIGILLPTARLHVDQASPTGAIPVLRLDQADVDDTFVDFIGTSAADGSRSISSDTTENSAKFGAIRVELNGVTKWLRIYDDWS